MRVRGHTAVIVGNVLIAIGAIALLVGLVSLVLGVLIINDASNHPQADHSDMGDFVQGLVLGGMVGAAGGLVALVAGLILRGVGRALGERARRLDEAPPAATSRST